MPFLIDQQAAKGGVWAAAGNYDVTTRTKVL